METTMYDTLLQLPLLQGLGRKDLTKILAKVKFNFCRYKPGDTIVKQGTPCQELYILLNGEVKSTLTDERQHFSIQEIFGTPLVIEPYSLFGMHTYYTASYEAYTPVDVVRISKSDVIDELSQYDIFRFNILNIISNRAQVAYRKLWDSRVDDVRHKIINFVTLRTQNLEGEKRLVVRMEDLAKLVGETRLNVSKELNHLQSEGLVKLSRSQILIPDLKALNIIVC
jgi:CRP-like cAMP-binding protein